MDYFLSPALPRTFGNGPYFPEADIKSEPSLDDPPTVEFRSVPSPVADAVNPEVVSFFPYMAPVSCVVRCEMAGAIYEWDMVPVNPRCRKRSRDHEQQHEEASKEQRVA